MKKKLFLMDIDGTIALGDTLLPYAKEFIQNISKKGGHIVYMSNNSTMSTRDYQRKFEKWDIQTERKQFLSAGLYAILYLKKYMPSKYIYIVGTDSYKEECRRAGILVADETTDNKRIHAVLVAFDQELCYEKVKKACLLLQDSEVDFLATNMDLRCPVQEGFLPDCGAICNLIASVVKREPVFLGKPSPEMVHCVIEKTGISRDATVLIGDRIYTDIACGSAAGVDTCAVLTGEANMEDIQRSSIKPTVVVKNLKEAERIYCRLV